MSRIQNSYFVSLLIKQIIDCAVFSIDLDRRCQWCGLWFLRNLGFLLLGRYGEKPLKIRPWPFGLHIFHVDEVSMVIFFMRRIGLIERVNKLINFHRVDHSMIAADSFLEAGVGLVAIAKIGLPIRLFPLIKNKPFSDFRSLFLTSSL